MSSPWVVSRTAPGIPASVRRACRRLRDRCSSRRESSRSSAGWLDGRAVARVCFVIAAARAERPGPARRAVSLVGDVMLEQEVVLARVVDAIEHPAQLVLVRSGEAVAERNVAVGRHAHEAEPRAARIGLAHAFVNFLERVAHVREAMAASGERRVEKLGGEVWKPVSTAESPRPRSRIRAATTSSPARSRPPRIRAPRRDGVDGRDIEILPGERDARADGATTMAREQHLDVRHDEVVAAHAVREDAELVLLLARPVDRHRDADVVRHDPVDDLFAQQRRVRRQTRVDLFSQRSARSRA